MEPCVSTHVGAAERIVNFLKRCLLGELHDTQNTEKRVKTHPVFVKTIRQQGCNVLLIICIS
jgi:hypothetical protein